MCHKQRESMSHLFSRPPSITSESETFLQDLPIRHIQVELPYLHLTFLSSSELDESSLKKSKSLKAAHTQDLIFWNFFFLSLKRFFFFVVALGAGVVSVGLVVLVE
jgi:hypothetical protein